MSKWDCVKLGSIAHFKNGLNFSKDSWGKGLKIIGVSDFKDYLYPKYETLDEINPNGVIRKTDLLKEDDILFVRSNGNRLLIGRSLHIKGLTEEISHSGFTIRLRFTSDLTYVPFYVYLLKSSLIRSTLSLHGGGTNINNLNQEILSNLDVPMPLLSVQKKIAAVLSTYDDLIENNDRRITLLEKMAEEIYREWFVRLRFPGHDQATFHKGIPEGWESVKLENIANFLMGQSPKSEFYNDLGDGLPFHQGVGTYGSRFPRNEVYCSVKGRLANKGDILFSVRAPVGRLNISDCTMVIGRGIASIRHKKEYNSYLFYLLKYYFSTEDTIGNGSIFNSVGKDELLSFEVLNPVESIVTKFDEITKKIDLQIENLYKSVDTLKQTRDRLLTRLISGKLSVEDLDIQFPPSMNTDP
jgi:type I restriction enzyme, S subunit